MNEKFSTKSAIAGAAAVVLIAAGAVAFVHTRPAPQTITLDVKHYQLAGSHQDITVRKGTKLTFRVNSQDTPEEMNIIIPGYHQKSTFSQNSLGNLEFTADQVGTFPVQLKLEDEKDARAVFNLIVKG